MIKHILNILTIAFAIVLFSGCDRELETEGITNKITFYPTFTLDGDEEMIVTPGSEFTLPGLKVTEEGNEIPYEMSISGSYFNPDATTIDTFVPDLYNVTYSAINKDGFAGTKVRKVFVVGQGDLVNSIEGVYTSTVERSPGPAPTFAGQYEDMEYVVIVKTGENTYGITDIIGGYYDLPKGRDYGTDYAAISSITANDISTNDFAVEPAPVGVFEGEATVQSFVVDPEEKTIKIESTWVADPETSYSFVITLKQVDFNE